MLHENTNDLPDAVARIKRIASQHGQPVSWVINDQEYLNLEGLLPDFLRWQKEGDSILVTMELTTSPAGVDKMDTERVIKWIGGQCEKAGFTPDGLWSLKFYETDLEALGALPADKYGWTRNLAGACWHQLGIDESTWLGVPYNPYYVAPWNAKAAAQPRDSQEFLMLEWLTRDITAILSGGFAATFSLDPADANRRDAGGFQTETEALRYSVDLIDETARQIALNDTVVVNINEEARHYQTEGHDKDFMLDGMFARFAQIASKQGALQAPCKDVWKHFRSRYKQTPQTIWACNDLDWRRGEIAGAGETYNNRVAGDCSVLFQDFDVQMLFLRSKGHAPVEIYNYADHNCGGNTNEQYPCKPAPEISIGDVRLDQQPDGLRIDLKCAGEIADDAGVMLWDIPVSPNQIVAATSSAVRTARVTEHGLFLRLDLRHRDDIWVLLKP
ncbi:MAG: hypothetical protein WCL39_13915 [Armatimonadota bacterium]